MIPRLTIALLVLHLCLIQLSQGEPQDWKPRGGKQFHKIRNSGPSKIFEWIGSRISKFPSILPKFPPFPKYRAPQKLPNYQVIIPDPPTSYHADGPEDHFGGQYENHGGNHYEGEGGLHSEEFKYESPVHNENDFQSYHEDGHSEQNFQQGHHHNQDYQHGGPDYQNYQQNDHEHQQYEQNDQKHQNYQENEFKALSSGQVDYKSQNQRQPTHYTKSTYHQSSKGNQAQKETHPKPAFIPPFKGKDSPIEVFPSKMIMYEKETFPKGQGQGAGWQDVTSINPSYVQESQNPAQLSQHYAQGLPAYSGPGSSGAYKRPEVSKQALKKVPVTPHSTGPDYFNTAYYHEGTFQTMQKTPVGPEYNTFGAAYSSAQHLPYFTPYPTQSHGSTGTHAYSQANNGLDYSSQDLPSLVSAIQENGFEPQATLHGGQGNIYSSYSQNSKIIPTNPSSKYENPSHSFGGQLLRQHSHAPPTPNSYIPLSPGVKLLKSQDRGNPAFEIIADADAPDFNGHPFDINKLISMIEPGASIIDVPQASQETSASEMKEVTVSKSTGKGSPDIYNSDSTNASNVLTYPNLRVTLDPKSSNSSSLKDLMNFFQRTNGKGYVVVEKKGPRETLNFLDSTNEVTSDDEAGTRLNITANSFPFTFPTTKTLTSTEPPSPPTTMHAPLIYFAAQTTTRHPNHKYNKNRKYPQVLRSQPEHDLEFSDSNVRSVAITVTPPPAVTPNPRQEHINASIEYLTTTSAPVRVNGVLVPVVTRKSVMSSTSSKVRPAPVYKKKLKNSQ